MSTFCNAFKIAEASVEKLKNFPLSCHPMFSTDKTFIFHLHHSGKAPLTEDKLPPLFLKRQCSLTTIASYQADYVIYTDGYASRGTRNGGAAAVVTRGSPLQPDVVTTIKTKGQTFTSSYEEEATAMESALSWTLTKANHPSISILLRSQ